MKARDSLKRGMKQVRDAVARVARDAEEGAASTHIDSDQPTNIKVAKNIRRDNSTAHASATQATPIEQHGDDETR